MKSLKTNQVCAIVLIGVVSNKLLILPSIMYMNVGQDAIFVLMFKFLLAILFIGIIMYVLSKNPNKTLRELVTMVIGDVGYRIIALLIFLIYFCKCFFLLMESELFLGETLYDDYATIMFLVPSIVVSGYIAYKGFRVVGRTCEIFNVLIIVGLLITFLFSINNVDITNILPLGINSFSNYFDALNSAYLWFGNYFILFFCLGDVKMEPNTVRRIIVTLVVSIIFVMAFFVICYAKFEYSSGFHKFAISDMTQFSPEIASFTKVDWFTIVIWMITTVLQGCVQIYVMQRTFFEATGFRKTQLFSFMFLTIFSLIYLFQPYNYNAFMIAAGVISPFILIVGLLILIIILIASRISRKKAVKND